MLRKKSNNLYGILVIPKVIKREMKIAGVLNSDYIDHYYDKRYIGENGTLYCYTSNFNYIKTWKTYSGSLKYLNNIDSRRFSGILSEEIPGFFDEESYDWNDCSYQIVEITDDWNKYIDREIEREKDRHSININRLEKKRIIK